MSNLLASLSAAGNALDVFQRALSVVQNNVGNASTPGYAAQQLTLQAVPMDTIGGMAGGVASTGNRSSRDQYADAEVQRQIANLGYATAGNQGISVLEGFFDTTGKTGVAGALTNLFGSFSAWSQTPGDTVVRQTVMNNASDLATSIRSLDSSLLRASVDTGFQVDGVVDQINALATQIARINLETAYQTQIDPATDAQLHSALEDLSNLVGISTLQQSDGSTTVLLGGGVPLVVGSHVLSLSSTSAVPVGSANPQGPPTSHIYDNGGVDITSRITDGKLGGLVDTRNRVLGSIIGDGGHVGTLNQLASNIADTINGILTNGTVSTAPGAAAGSPLFTYDASDATAAAGSLALNSGLAPGQLAGADASGISNGNILKLTALADPAPGTGPLNGVSWIQHFGMIAGSVGREARAAQDKEQTGTQVLAQAKSLRDQLSGVSLDGEAAKVLEFQRAYQAIARVLTVINGLADSALNIISQ